MNENYMNEISKALEEAVAVAVEAIESVNDEMKEEEEMEERKELGVCAECGQVVFEGDDHITLPNGDLVCRDCMEYFAPCSDCEAYHEENEMFIVNRGYCSERCVCENCIGEYYRCDSCEDDFTRDKIYIDDYGNCVCDECLNDNYYICENCGRIVCVDYAYTDDCGNSYCETCWEYRLSWLNCGKVWGYHEYPAFYRLDGDNDSLLLGVELETTEGNRFGDYINDLYEVSKGYEEYLFYLAEDCTILDQDTNGVEVITQPATLEYHLNRFPWKQIVETAKQYNYRSHSAREHSCGLHVHVNRMYMGRTDAERDLTAAKIAILFERLWEPLKKFSRRTDFRWCNDIRSYKGYNEFNENDSEYELCEKAKRKAYGHSKALNLGNAETVEFRVFCGTLKLNTIKATLEFVANMTEFAKRKSVSKCFNVTWDQMVNFRRFPELDQYLDERELNVPAPVAEGGEAVSENVEAVA